MFDKTLPEIIYGEQKYKTCSVINDGCLDILII